MPDGSMVALGSFSGTATFGSTTLTAQSNDSYYMDGFHDLYIARMSSTGTWLWAKKFDSDIRAEIVSSGSYESHALAAGPDGSIFVTGWLEGLRTAVFDSITLANTREWAKPFIAKMDANGNWLWVRSNDGSAYFGWGNLPVAVASDGSAYMAVAFAYYDITFGNFTVPFTSNCCRNNSTVLARISANGEWLWAKGISPRMSGAGLQTDSNNNVYFYGGFAESKDNFTTSWIFSNSDAAAI